jgi:hypothetical protein
MSENFLFPSGVKPEEFSVHGIRHKEPLDELVLVNDVWGYVLADVVMVWFGVYHELFAVVQDRGVL